MGVYLPRVDTVDAVQHTSNPAVLLGFLGDVAGIVSSPVKAVAEGVQERTTGAYRIYQGDTKFLLEIGDWIMVDDGKINVMTNAVFDEAFDPAP